MLPKKRLGLRGYGVIDARLPSAAAPTPYSRWGDAPFAGLLLLSIAAWFVGRRRRPRAAPDLQTNPTLGAI